MGTIDPFFHVEVYAEGEVLLSVGPFPTRDAAREAALEFRTRARKRLSEAALECLDIGIEEYNEPFEATYPTVEEGSRRLKRLLD